MFKEGDVACGYQVIEPLGQGGFSEIYKARAAAGQLVTLKVPLASIIGDPAVYERFRREFAIGQKLSHPAFPHAIALERDTDVTCLVIEYIEGTSLRAYLQQHAPLPLDEVVSKANELADALGYLHEQGVCHRDLKPENVIVGNDGRVHIVDFGLALLQGARRVTWGPLTDAAGTPDYMAPEQIQGKRGDARTDIYALGTVIYEMLTGDVPFSGDNALAVMNQHLAGTPVPPREINPAIPPAVQAIVLKAIRRSPDERYQTAGELLYDLKHLNELDLTRFPNRKERQVRGVVTDRQIWTLSAAIAIGFLAIAALIILVMSRMRQP